MLSAKVLVVGGGPAGATAARFLAQNGVDVILLERNLSFVKTCGGGVPLSTFDELGIPKTVIKKEVNNVKIVSPIGECLDIELRGGSLAIVERGVFDNVLRKQAEEHGVKVLEGEFLGIANDKPYKVEANVGEAKTEIVSEYIIAADGVNSKVRRSLAIKPSRSLFTVCEYIKGTQTNACEFWFGSYHAPGLYSWIFPAAGGFSIGTGCFEPGGINIFLRRFKERKKIMTEGRKRVYRIPMWKGDLYNKGRVLFSGDSAGQVLPLIYEGIYYAMKSGEFAARAVIAGRVDHYKKLWKDRFQKRFTFMDKLRNYFLKDDVSAEKLVALYRRPEVQEASMNLWLRKDSSREGIMRYIKLFGKLLR